MDGKWRTALAVLALPAVLVASDARAAGDGVYVGIAGGQASIQGAGPGGTVDLTSYKGYKAIVGYRKGAIPLVDLAGEATYTDFGSATQTVAGQLVEYKLRGPSVAGLLILPLGPLDLYGKVGAFSYSSDANIGGTGSSRTGTSSFYGGGFGFRVLKLWVRAEYEYYNVPSVDRAQLYMASLLLQF